jgi:hypothetical protein
MVAAVAFPVFGLRVVVALYMMIWMVLTTVTFPTLDLS